MGNEQEQQRETFKKQLERLKQREAILKQGAINEGLFNQKNPNLANKLRGLKRGISRARVTREKDLENL